MKKVKVNIERGADGSYGAYMPDMAGLDFTLIGNGSTIDEAVADFYNSYDELKQMNAQEGRETPEVEFDFNID